MDRLEVAVSVLSVLTTILITWQIYAIIDIRRIKKSVYKKREQIIVEAERNSCCMSMAMGDLYYTSLVDVPEEQRITKYILYKMYSIGHASNIKDFNTCNASAKFLIETITDTTTVRKKSKKIICQALQNISNKNFIEDYEKLAEKIYKLQIE